MAKVILGTESNYVRDLDEALDIAKENKQDFVIIPLFHPRSRRDAHSSSRWLGPGTRSDMVLESNEWITNVVGKIDEVGMLLSACIRRMTLMILHMYFQTIDLDNPCRKIQRNSEEIFKMVKYLKNIAQPTLNLTNSRIVLCSAV